LQFSQLLRDVHRFQSTIANPQSRLLPLVGKLDHALKSGDHSAVSTVLSEQAAWHRITTQFLSSLDDSFLCYRDLLLPYMAGVVGAQSGLQWMATALETASLKAQLLGSVSSARFSALLDSFFHPQHGQPLEIAVKSLGSFPRPQPTLDLAQELMGDKMINLFETLDKKSDYSMAFTSRYTSSCPSSQI
jgi:hypothetical protein